MKITFKNTPEQAELVKAMGSKNPAVSIPAQEVFAANAGMVIQQVILQASTAGVIYEDYEFREDEPQSIPLDLFIGEAAGLLPVWSQNNAGGLPSATVEGSQDLRFSTYQLESAVSFMKKYARYCRLPVIAKALLRMSQEILVKQEVNAYTVALTALAQGLTNGTKHTITSSTQNVFSVNDVSRLITLSKRLNQSFSLGTPTGLTSKGLTDLFMSPEIMEQVRAFAFNPMNSIGSQSTGPVPLPNETRQQIFDAAGAKEIFGITLHELYELGSSRKYNTLFGALATAGIAAGSGNFADSSDEVILGFDLSASSLIRPVAIDADAGDGGQVVVTPDNQWTNRSDKAGFFSTTTEGRVCLDSRKLLGIVV